MKTYIYQDEKSHKFWAVEQQGNELHINWGKVGTNGQSQVKSFADAAAAAKAELKLIAEKTKKGLRRRSIRDNTDICPRPGYRMPRNSPFATRQTSICWRQPPLAGRRRPNHFTDRGCANHTKSSTLAWRSCATGE